jgi:two-component sensor histidine kinase
MQQRLFVFLLSGLSWLPVSLRAQPIEAQPIPAAVADSLRGLLLRARPDTQRVNLLLRVGAYYLYKPMELKADLDSARRYAREAEAMSRSLHYNKGHQQSLELMGNISVEAQQIPGARAYYRLLMQTAQRANNLRGVAHAYLLLAKTYPAGHRDSTVQFALLRQSLQAYRRAGDKRGEGELLRHLADFHQSYGRYGQSLVELEAALRIEETPPVGTPHYVYDLMAHVYQQLGNYGDAVRCSLESIRRAQALRDTSRIQTFYLRLGWLYFGLDEWEEGIAYMKKGGYVFQHFKQTDRVLSTAEVITDGLIHQKKYREALGFATRTLREISAAEKLQPPNLVSRTATARMLARVHFYNGNYRQADEYFNQYLQLLGQKVSYPPEWAQAYADVGTFYVQVGRLAEARQYLNRALALREQLGNKAFFQIRDIHYQFFRLDSLRGDFKSALAHYQQYKVLNDSIFNRAKSRQIASLRVQFDTEKKEQTLRLKEQNIRLLTRQSQLQQSGIRQAQLLRNVTLAGAAMLSLLLAVLYNRYRLKRRSNGLLEAQQKEINQKNKHLSELLTEKESLLVQKDLLLGEKDGLLSEKDLLLLEKEWLLREIHHRVKNNLQIVMSLLNSQAASLEDQAALLAIQDSQHRVQAMALIHQKLYQSEGVSRIEMASYIGEVADYLRSSYHLPQPIGFALDVEPIELDVTLAVPLGLIINEAITNAFKYAFPCGRSGTLRLALHRVGPTGYELTIEDNGMGLPAGFDPARSRSLGMSLMHGFSQQLGGELSITSRNGLRIRLSFAEEPISPLYVSATASYA